jgi:hypothetical protein
MPEPLFLLIQLQECAGIITRDNKRTDLPHFVYLEVNTNLITIFFYR